MKAYDLMRLVNRRLAKSSRLKKPAVR